MLSQPKVYLKDINYFPVSFPYLSRIFPVFFPYKLIRVRYRKDSGYNQERFGKEKNEESVMKKSSKRVRGIF